MTEQYPHQPGGPVHAGQPYTIQPPPVPPKKSRRWLPWLAYPIVFVVGGVVGSSGGGTTTTGAGVPGPTVTVTQAPSGETYEEAERRLAEEAERARKAASATPKPTATKAPTPQWVRLAAMTGATDKNSNTVTTTGGNVRIRYTFRGDGVGAIYFLDEGTDLQTDGGIPVAGMVMEATSDSIVLRKAAGQYYVHVSSTMRYSVVVEEQR